MNDPRSGLRSIHDDLRARIISVDLAPGTPLSEARIAQVYGVSRTPVREAFKRLAEDGFLAVVPQVGTFVARIDPAVVDGNLFVRETLECRIAGLAADRIDEAGRRDLLTNLDAQQAAIDQRDADGFFLVDEALHRLLAAIAGQSAAWSVIHAAKAQLDRVRRLSLGDPARVRTRLAEHREIVARVIAGDGTGAADAMRAHVRSVLDAMAPIALRHPDYFSATGAPRGTPDR